MEFFRYKTFSVGPKKFVICRVDSTMNWQPSRGVRVRFIAKGLKRAWKFTLLKIRRSEIDVLSSDACRATLRITRALMPTIPIIKCWWRPASFRTMQLRTTSASWWSHPELMRFSTDHTTFQRPREVGIEQEPVLPANA